MNTLKIIFTSLFFWFFSWYFLKNCGLTADQSLYGGAILASIETSLNIIIQLLYNIYKKMK